MQKKSNNINIERAKKTPGVVFDSPHDVVEHSGLSDADKVEILLRWRHDAIQIDVAQNENMQSERESELREVVNALTRLGHRP